MFLIKLYDATLKQLIKALRKAAEKARKAAEVSDKVAAEAEVAANSFRSEAALLEARADKLKQAL